MPAHRSSHVNSNGSEIGLFGQYQNTWPLDAPAPRSASAWSHASKRQAGEGGVRVLYTKAGTRLSAARISATDALVDHKAYWAPVHSTDEAR